MTRRLSSPTTHKYGPGYWLASTKRNLIKQTWPSHSEVEECTRMGATHSVTELVITIIIIIIPVPTP